MDIETSTAIEGVGKRIDRLEQRIDALEVSIRAEFSLVRHETQQGLADTRRHAEILHEAVRDDIRMLAERFATISVKLDAMQR
jgi:hypothetical protein